MAITIDWGTKVINVPRADLTLIQSVPTEIRQLDLNVFRLTLKDLEDDADGIIFLDTHNHNTEVSVGGVDLARVIEIINGYTVTFEDGQYAVNLSGANSNVGDVVNVNQVSVRSANSAGLVTSQAIEFGEYGGAVTVDVVNGVSGTIYPTGTFRQPVNNIPDAVAIAEVRGFYEIYVVGDLTLDTGDDVSDMKLIGTSHVNSALVVNAGANTLRTAFEAFDITGVLDGNSEIWNCVVQDLTFFNGHIHNSSLNGTVYLDGAIDAKMSNCSMLSILNIPTIDAGGTGQNLAMTNYSGRVNIANITGPSQIGVGLDAGSVYILNTCTDGIIAVSGAGKVYDDSGDGCFVVDTVVDGSNIQGLARLIESLRSHHTGDGHIIYWSPFTGDDTNTGDHQDRGVATFAQAHALANTSHHDIIMCVADNPAGITEVFENITIAKDYTFVRGPGRDFIIHNNTDDLSAAVSIPANGAELSGVIVKTNTTNTVAAIECSGSFPLIQDVYIEESANGIHVSDGSFGIIEQCRISHGTGYGLKVDGGSTHFNIQDVHVGSNSSDGIIIDQTSGHEVTIKGHTIIHGNGGYGINISATTSNCYLGKDLSVYNNTSGSILDLSADTYKEKREDNIEAAKYVWTNATGVSLIENIGHLTKKIHIDTEALVNGTGTQQSPYDNITDAIDHAEAENIRDLVVYGDLILDRQMKNFTVTGVGNPTIDCNGQTLTNTEFFHCNMEGTYTGSITIQEGVLLNGFELNGYFEKCGLAGDLTCIDGSSVVIMNCASVIAGTGRPTISMNGLGSSDLSIRNNGGGMTIKDCNNILDTVTAEVNQGQLLFDSSCTAGEMVARGVCEFTDETIGATVVDQTLKPSDVSNMNKLMGLNVDHPVTTTQTSADVDTIHQDITGDGVTTSTITRTA